MRKWNWENKKLAKKLNPETLVRAVAVATLESESWPRCPTIITDTTCRRYCSTVTVTIGAAIVPAFFSSSMMALLVIIIHPVLVLCYFFHFHAYHFFHFAFCLFSYMLCHSLLTTTLSSVPCPHTINSHTCSISVLFYSIFA